MAKFKINSAFKLAGRGLVLAGNIIEGEIKSGDIIQLVIGDSLSELEIDSIEYVNHSSKKSELGLVIVNFDENVNNHLPHLIGQTIPII